MPAKDPERRRATARAWYQLNKVALSKRDGPRRRINRRARRHSIAKWFVELKSRLVCSVCGEDHPGCIQFHHPDPDEKETDVSEAVRRGWARDRILSELQKCTVLCANCHAKHHAREASV